MNPIPNFSAHNAIKYSVSFITLYCLDISITGHSWYLCAYSSLQATLYINSEGYFPFICDQGVTELFISCYCEMEWALASVAQVVKNPSRGVQGHFRAVVPHRPLTHQNQVLCCRSGSPWMILSILTYWLQPPSNTVEEPLSLEHWQSRLLP